MPVHDPHAAPRQEGAAPPQHGSGLEHGIAPGRVSVDHNNEETVPDVLDRGFWAAFTIYPNTKMGNERMVEIVQPVRLRAHHREQRRRLGHLRPAGGAQDGAR